VQADDIRADFVSPSLSVGTAADSGLMTVAVEDDGLSVDASGAEFTTAEVAAAEVGLKFGARLVVASAVMEDVGGCVGLHIEADSVVNSEATNDARLKKARKAEAMETATAEPLATPETKMRRVDGALLVESETGSVNVAAAKSRPWNWDTFSRSQKRNWRKRHE